MNNRFSKLSDNKEIKVNDFVQKKRILHKSGYKKLKKQKGTGGARAGSVKSGTRVGGGRIFGPKPRNYSFKLNVKLKRLARKSAFSYKAK